MKEKPTLEKNAMPAPAPAKYFTCLPLIDQITTKYAKNHASSRKEE